MDYWLIIPVAVYLIAISVIGYYTAKSSSEGVYEFFIGGQMNRTLAAISSVVSGRSIWLLLFLAGQAYTFGISSVWALIGYLVADYMLFRFVGPRLKHRSGTNKNITIPGLLSSMFSEHRIMRIAVSSVFVFFMTAFIAWQINSGGKFIYNNFSIPVSTGIILTGVILLFYTIIGGLQAIALSDLILSVFLMLVFIIIPVFGINDLGGIEEIRNRLSVIDTGFFSITSLSGGVLIGFLGFGLLSPGNPHILTRFMAVKDASGFRSMALTGTLMNILLGTGAILAGLLARISFPNIESIPGKDAQNAFFTLSQTVLPSILTGMVIVSILGSFISAAASYLLISSSAIADIHEHSLKKKTKYSKKKMVTYSRIAMAMIFYVAVMAGLLIPKWVSVFVLNSWPGLAASLGPSVLLTLYWRKATGNGVIAGFFSGILVTVLWQLIPTLKLIDSFIPGFFVSLIVSVAFSLVETRIQRIRYIKKHSLMKSDKIRIILNAGN